MVKTRRRMRDVDVETNVACSVSLCGGTTVSNDRCGIDGSSLWMLCDVLDCDCADDSCDLLCVFLRFSERQPIDLRELEDLDSASATCDTACCRLVTHFIYSRPIYLLPLIQLIHAN